MGLKSKPLTNQSKTEQQRLLVQSFSSRTRTFGGDFVGRCGHCLCGRRGRSVDGRTRRGARAADGLRIHHPLLLSSFSSSFPPSVGASLARQSTAILSLLWRRRRPTYRAIITRENIFLCRENDVFYIGVSERQEENEGEAAVLMEGKRRLECPESRVDLSRGGRERDQ